MKPATVATDVADGTGRAAVDTGGASLTDEARAALDEVAGPHDPDPSPAFDGETMQATKTDDPVFSLPEIIACFSQWYRFEPGDIVTTGTPSGVGFGRDPKVFPKPGHTVEVTISGVGTLRNPVVPAASWSPWRCCTAAADSLAGEERMAHRRALASGACQKNRHVRSRGETMRNATRIAVAAGLSAGMVAAATSASAESFTLRMASGHPDSKTPGFYVTEMVDFFAPEVQKRVEARTDHEIEFITAVGGAIVKVNESLEGAQNGLVDIAGGCWCFEPTKLFLHNFQMYLPFGPQDSAQITTSARMTYDAVPWLSETFEKEYNQTLLGLAAIDSYHITTREPWDKVEDLEGVRIAGAGPNLKWIEFAGAVPVQSNMAEAYQALATGVYDGWIMFPSLTYGFKLHEHAPYYTLIGFGAKIIHGVTINNQSLDKLPPEVQDILYEVGREYELRVGHILSVTKDKPLEDLENAGATIRTLPSEVREQWAESLRAWPNEQAQEANKRGFPGTEVLRTDIQHSERVGYTWPIRYEIKDSGS